ncbi:hypothetical protein AVEN_145076-1 [Araneus ventricosus]|uniref:Uncharacterized protein n=1 Tax=Araneus ventricosus TaxID=182803 RepID=A0A4Y2J3B0_ARAVE|nr:hypothetical protein AVEN_145076-1 [Araneus ventricosus]
MKSKQRGKNNLERLRACAGCHGYCRRPGKGDSRRKVSLHPAFIRDCASVLFLIITPKGYVISPDNFCFICGEYTVKSQQRNVSNFVKKVYFVCFKLKLADQDKPWHHKACRRCEEVFVCGLKDESSSDFSVDEGPQPFSQSELNDLLRDLGLSKDGAELLGSRRKDKNLLTPRVSFSWYRHREKEFTQFFSKEGNLVFRNDVQGLMKCFDIEYDPSEWSLFIDSSKTSLKAVLLHDGNLFASLPLAYSVH